METRPAVFPGVDPIQHQHVQVHIEVQRAAEALDEGDDAGAGTIGGLQTRPLRKAGLYGSGDHGQAAAQSLRAAGEEHAQRPGEAQDPLAHRYGRDDVVDEVGRGLDHAPGAAGRTKPTPFAGKSYQLLVAAAVALDADEAVFEQAAAQVVVELPGDERR